MPAEPDRHRQRGTADDPEGDPNSARLLLQEAAAGAGGPGGAVPQVDRDAATGHVRPARQAE